jgi:hypothetical protein
MINIINNVAVYESGDDVHTVSESRTILMANHLGLVDHFVLMSALNNKGTLAGRVRGHK